MSVWFAAPTMILLSIVIFLVLAWILKCLWNMTMPDVFGIKEITFWQALRLMIIAAILFGSSELVSFKYTASESNFRPSIVNSIA